MTASLPLSGRRTVVTGAGRGIGAAIARGLAAQGAAVMIADLNPDTAAGVADEIRKAGGKAASTAVDVRERASVAAMLDRTIAEFGGLDVVFNNAGIAQVRPFLAITEDDWRTVMDVNGLGVLIGMQEAITRLRAQGTGGAIINTASIAGKQGYEPLAHYSVSKFAVVALTQAAARAFGAENIRVNAICPGVVATNMWKLIDQGFRDSGLTGRENEAFDQFAAGAVLGRPSRAEDLVGVACFLASDAAAFMTGQTLLVDGGMVMD